MIQRVNCGLLFFWRQFRSRKVLFVTRNHLRFKYTLMSCHIGPIYQLCHCPRCKKLSISVQEGALQHLSISVEMWCCGGLGLCITWQRWRKKSSRVQNLVREHFERRRKLWFIVHAVILASTKKLRTKVTLYSLWDIFFRFLILSNKNLER